MNIKSILSSLKKEAFHTTRDLQTLVDVNTLKLYHVDKLSIKFGSLRENDEDVFIVVKENSEVVAIGSPCGIDDLYSETARKIAAMKKGDFKSIGVFNYKYYSDERVECKLNRD